MTQQAYIDILFIDNGYSTSVQRRGWMQKRFGRSYADELTVEERSRAIDMLKEEKEGRSPEGYSSEGYSDDD